MLSDLMNRIRPAADTADAINAARDATRAAMAAASDRLRGLETARGAAALAGGAAERDHEAALRAARDEAERLAAVAAELERRHAAAERRERREALERRVAAVEAQAAAAAEAIRRKWPKLGAELLALLEGEASAEARILGLANAFLADPEAAEGLALPGSVKARYLTPDPSGGCLPALPFYQLVEIPPPHCRWTASDGSAWSPGYGSARAAGAE